MRKIIPLLAALFISVSAFAQGTVKGKVVDQNGEPLAGVGVMAVGTTYGVVTDIDGNYSIDVQSSVKKLSFSFIGMETKEVEIAGKKVINVTLADDSTILDEVVVVGYGVQKKAHMTGSVVAVSSHELQKTTVSNVSQALVGKLPGVITQQGSGQPGCDGVSILVRGYSSYNDSGSVLVLVDGVERDMNSVNPVDIESISVLKDAAASAVYGMKAANGVILVTTKRGTEGTSQINYSGKYILSQSTAFPKMMNGTEYMEYYNLAYLLDGNDEPYFSEEMIAATHNGDVTDGIENTDWTAPMFRVTPMQQHNISVSGGNNKANYFVSAGYQYQEGFIKGNTNTRYNIRSNVDIHATKDITVSMGIGVNDTEFVQPGNLPYSNATTGGTIPFCLTYALPFIPKEYNGQATSPMRTSSSFVANAEYGSENGGYSKSSTFNVESSAKVEWAVPFVKGLKASMFASWDKKSLNSKTFYYSYYVYGLDFASMHNDPNFFDNLDTHYELKKSSTGYDDGNLYEGVQNVQRIMMRPQVSYNRTFGKHNVGVIFLYEQNDYTSHVISAQKRTFELLDIAELGKATAIDRPESVGGSSGLSRYAGYVGRLNYVFNDKYLLEFAGRYDGSYHFAREQRWGFFPSASIGWVVSKEDFFRENFTKVDMFKLRASIGEVGNDNVSEYLYRKNYALNTGAVAFGQTAQATLSNQTSYPREDLTWERIRTYDAGFEFSAWKGLLSAEFDWFYKYTYNILCSISSQYSPSLGGHYPTTMNMGEFDNRGFELSLRHQNHFGDFTYGVSGNVSWAHNRVVKRVEAENTLPWQSVIGHSYGEVMGYKSAGLFQSEEEIATSALPDGVSVHPGDIKYVDLNGDGVINADDITYIGRSTRPEMMYALQFDASWRGLDFSVQFQGGAMCDKFLLGSWSNGVSDATPLTRPWYAGYDNAPLYLVQESWRPDHTDANYPRLTIANTAYSNNYRVSDYWMRNGAYVRLKNIQLGYTIPAKITRLANISKIRLFVAGTNLFTLTEFEYLDPESPNVVTSYYPQQKTYTFGVDVSF